MERFINRVELRGNVGQDPRVNEVGEGVVIRFSLATNEIYKDRSGVLKEETTWHNIVAWAGRGMPDFKEIKKGTCLSITGKIRNHKYTTSDGEEKQYNEVLSNILVIETIEKKDGENKIT